jgi:hypothetical protein
MHADEVPRRRAAVGLHRFHQRSAISLAVSTLGVSRKDQQPEGCEEIAAIARALYAEAEMTR